MGRPGKFPPQFRREAVELVKTSGRSIADVARGLEIGETTLATWLRADREAAARLADPDGLRESEREELKRLRKENAELRIDREILRKAAAYFARETMR